MCECVCMQCDPDLSEGLSNRETDDNYLRQHDVLTHLKSSFSYLSIPLNQTTFLTMCYFARQHKTSRISQESRL